VIDPSLKIEEERLPCYKHGEYYPMRIGEVIQGRYQVVAKLGYGTTSTVWLSRDLRYTLLRFILKLVIVADYTRLLPRAQEYWALKVHINTLHHNQELQVYRHLAGIDVEHPGRQHVRQLKNSFKLKGPCGEHDVFIMTPLGMSLRTLQEMQGTGVFPKTLVTSALSQVLLGLNFLHEAEVIHTGKYILTNGVKYQWENTAV
jgi:serine/threonine protein kinase